MAVSFVRVASGRPGGQLRGRQAECEALDLLLDRLRAGQSCVLVLRGEAGSGKTALLEYAARSASGCRVARAAGVEAEMELAFAGLHQLCAPLLGKLPTLPPPQRDAIDTAFGLSAGDRPDPFLIGLAALSLVSEAAEEATSGVSGGRCAVARQGVGASARVRSAPPPCRIGGADLLGSRAERDARARGTSRAVSSRTARRRCPRAARLGGARATGCARARSHPRRGPRQSARAARVAGRADAGAAGGRVRAPRHDAAVEPHRARLRAAASLVAVRDTTTPPDRGRRACGRRERVVARGGAARDRAGFGGSGGVGRPDRARGTSHTVPASARPLGCVPDGREPPISARFTRPSPM